MCLNLKVHIVVEVIIIVADAVVQEAVEIFVVGEEAVEIFVVDEVEIMEELVSLTFNGIYFNLHKIDLTNVSILSLYY